MKQLFLSILTIFLLTSICLIGCNMSPSDGSSDGTYTGLTEEEAVEIIYYVYSEFNDYALRGPGDHYKVTVSEAYGVDFIEAQYQKESIVEFDGFTEDENSINGSGTIGSYYQSSDETEGAIYVGTFTGMYGDQAYSIVMDFQIWNDPDGLDSSGGFVLNGGTYAVEPDEDWFYDFFPLF